MFSNFKAMLMALKTLCWGLGSENVYDTRQLALQGQVWPEIRSLHDRPDMANQAQNAY